VFGLRVPRQVELLANRSSIEARPGERARPGARLRDRRSDQAFLGLGHTSISWLAS